jgi:four helix bundle protein
MLNLNHKNLDVWKLSKELVRNIYDLTNRFPKSEQYGVTSQLRRASVSIVCNIAEGSARKSALDRKRFFEISRSSLVEIDSLMEICKDMEFVNDEEFNKIGNSLELIFKKLSKLINVIIDH